MTLPTPFQRYSGDSNPPANTHADGGTNAYQPPCQPCASNPPYPPSVGSALRGLEGRERFPRLNGENGAREYACETLQAAATKPASLIEARVRLHRAQAHRDAIEAEYVKSIAADIDRDTFFASTETRQFASERVTADMEVAAAQASEEAERARFAPIFAVAAGPAVDAARAVLDGDLAGLELIAGSLVHLSAFAAASGLENPFPGVADLVEAVKLLRRAIGSTASEFVTGLPELEKAE